MRAIGLKIRSALLFIVGCIAGGAVLAVQIPCIIARELAEAFYRILERLCDMTEEASARLSRNLWAMGVADAVKLSVVEAGDYTVCNMKCGSCGGLYCFEVGNSSKPMFCPTCGRRFVTLRDCSEEDACQCPPEGEYRRLK